MPIPNHHKSRITPTMIREVFLRDGEVCQMCGARVGDLDPCDGTPIHLTADFIAASEGKRAKAVKNMRVICSCCSDGLRGLLLPKPDRIHLLSQMRRATIDDQEAVLSWLLTKFGMVATKKS